MNANPRAQFAPQQYLNLETYRKSGKPVQTPLWFAEENGVLYCTTHASAGKVKRIRKNPHVRFVPCTFGGTPKGIWVEGTARIADAAASERGEKLLRQKYSWKKAVGNFFARLRGSPRLTITLHFD